MDNNLTYRLTLKDFFRKTMLGAADDTKKLDGNMNKLNQTISRFGNGVAGYFAFSGISSMVKNIVLATAAMSSFNNAIIASARSEGEGIANLTFLNKQVDRLGINLEAAKAGYKTFSGAVMGSSIQGEKSNKIFRQVSEAATVLGLSAEQTEGSFLALGQMISKGTVQAEELRGQLAERIPGAFQIGARAMGMTSKQLGEAMKDGLINADEFLVKFGNELEKTFGSKLENATHSLTANLNRMGNEWDRLLVNIGNSQSGIIAGTVSWAGQIIKNLNRVIETANKVDQAFKSAGLSGYTFMERFNDWLFMGSTNDFINNNFTGGKGKDAMLERSLQTMYVGSAQRSEVDALGSKADLLRLRAGYSKAFAKKEIGDLEYKKGLALIGSALKEVEGAVASFRSKNDAPMKDAGKKSSSIGSATEVSGSRPQNVNIYLERLGDVDVTVQTMTEAINEVKDNWSKGLLEVLNDANLIARR